MSRRAALPRLAVAALATGALALSGCSAGDGAGSDAGDAPPQVVGSAPTHADVDAGAHPNTALWGQRATAAPLRTAKRPNVLFVTVDDASPKDLPYLPQVRKLLRKQGTTLTQGIAPTPLCVPARASLLTGEYAHNHGAGSISGEDGGFQAFEPHEGDTLPVWLQGNGYRTMFLGKYLNGYDLSDVDHRPPGWDVWQPTVDPSTYNYVDPKMIIDGRLVETHTYNSTLLRDQSRDLITSASQDAKPWYLWVNYVAPHVGGPPDPGDPADVGTPHPLARDLGTFSKLGNSRTPDMYEKDTSDKVLLRGVHDVVPQSIRDQYTVARQQRIEALQSVDRAVRDTVATLRRLHELKNTYIVFTSDNGYALGEHNLSGKNFYFGPVQQIPMVIRGPGIPAGRTSNTPVTNADWAPTIAALTGTTPGPHVDGVDVLPWLTSGAGARVVPVEDYPVKRGTGKPLYTGIAVGDWLYVRKGLTHRREELYDRSIDPYELVNLRNDQRFKPALRHLRHLADKYDECAATSCPTTFYLPPDTTRSSTPAPSSSSSSSSPAPTATASGQ